MTATRKILDVAFKQSDSASVLGNLGKFIRVTMYPDVKHISRIKQTTMTTYTKRFYRLSEVSSLLNIPASTINYWAMTFDELDPPTTKGGHRRYRPQDIELIKQIAVMMHDKVMSIEGAKKQLKNSHVPYRGYKCESAEDVARLIDEVSKTIQDNPRSLAMLDAVRRWFFS